MRKTIVFIPGLLNTEKLWAYQAQELAKEYNIFHADTYNYESFSEMADIIVQQTAGKLILVGMSMGGYCALETLLRHKKRIAGVVLFNTTALPPTQEIIEERLKRVEKSKVGRFVGIAPPMMDKLLGTKNCQNKELRNILFDMAIECGREVYARQQIAIVNRPDYTECVSQNDIPFLCIGGSEDITVPVKDLKATSDVAKNSTFYELESCGHIAPMEFPEETTRFVKKWLQSEF